MKREAPHLKPEYGIRKIFPLLFWHGCWKCKKEFRHEPAWELFMWSGTYIYDVMAQLCFDCAPTIEHAIEWRKQQRKLRDILLVPLPPPPPPPIIYTGPYGPR